MIPGGPGGDLVSLVLCLVLHLGEATGQLQGATNDAHQGNVGCLFSGLVCGDNEICFNDLVLGRCVSASSTEQDLTRLGPLEGPPLGLLEAELARVFGLGFSWPDLYTQCVFQTLLHHIENRLPYSRQECTHLLEAQGIFNEEEEDEGEREKENIDEESIEPSIDEIGQDEEEFQPGNNGGIIHEQDNEIDQQPIYFPEDDIEHIPYYYKEDPRDNKENEVVNPITYDLNSDAADNIDDDDEVYIPLELDLTPEEIEDLEIQQALDSGQAIPSDYEELGPWDFYLQQPPRPEESVIFLKEYPDMPPQGFDSPPLFPSQDSYLHNLQENTLPSYEKEPSIFIPNLPKTHRQEKRDAPNPNMDDELDQPSSYNLVYDPQLSPDYSSPNFVLFPPIDADYEVPDNFPNIVPQDEVDEDNLPDVLDTVLVENPNDMRVSPDSENRDIYYPQPTMDYDYSPEDLDNLSNSYDFYYPDSSEETDKEDPDEDVIYYENDDNNEDKPTELSSVFDRRERLDVKKPGPFFSNSHNNFFLDKLVPRDSEEKEELEKELPSQEEGQTEFESPLSPQQKKTKKDLKEPLVSYSEPEDQSKNYLHVNIKDRFNSLGQANRLVDYIADHLQVKRKVFTDVRPEQSRLLLEVNSNPSGLNASRMADLLSKDPALKEHVKNDLGLELDHFAAGDKDSVISIYSGPSNRLFLLLFILTAGLFALLLIFGILLLLRKRARLQTKLSEAKPEKDEPVKEYKQLVRDWSRSSRASGGSNSSNGEPSKDDQGQATKQKESNAAAAGRAADKAPAPNGSSPVNKAVKRSSQNSDGSRTSSTSSWHEDPGVTTMDISTGHMVLSYMEDHLKNKQRLEQEWVGLCAYEAEPNSTSIAFKVENKKKNRYPDKLPYDHNRVLLNALVNGSNSDYINASTVMDHDPRNPAYIITQGPLAHTVADFWQMVWEQGSVVIVMLSRLSENGYQLAHRYWPEEGSEQYHIFEVHLVSEHVWCDDYLVRSLYLKNSQTGETRTVTQFHFLSWPDGNIPTSTRAILEFRRKVNKSYRGRSCPMIVHCSDGVGRSGTYVLIDMVLNRMTKGSKEIDIAATLEHIRDQRSGMVQTRSQFEFCLMAVAEETHAILKALPQ